jgi:L-cystine transport system substrate-binding protein
MTIVTRSGVLSGTHFHPSCISATAKAWLSVLSVVGFLVALSMGVQASAEADLGTIERGKIHIAFNGDMPMTALRHGTLVGTDGEMISRIAERLGLEIVPEQMDWASAIESTVAGRVDLMLGAVGWTEERSNVMLLTDPIYYFGVLLAQTTATNYHTFADMQGRTVGTVIGFSLVPELKTVPGIGEVRLYDTSDAVMRDLVAGRLDMAILDPPLVALAIKEHPEWNLHQVPLTPDPTFPIMSTTYSATIGIHKNETVLADAINHEIANLWDSCENQVIMAKYGVTDPSFFTPPNPNPRIGVDRPEGWRSPTLNPDCGSDAKVTPAE